MMTKVAQHCSAGLHCNAASFQPGKAELCQCLAAPKTGSRVFKLAELVNTESFRVNCQCSAAEPARGPGPQGRPGPGPGLKAESEAAKARTADDHHDEDTALQVARLRHQLETGGASAGWAGVSVRRSSFNRYSG